MEQKLLHEAARTVLAAAHPDVGIEPAPAGDRILAQVAGADGQVLYVIGRPPPATGTASAGLPATYSGRGPGRAAAPIRAGAPRSLCNTSPRSAAALS